MDVRDKVVAITGAARGLGQEFATSLAASGARVVVGDLNDCADTLDRVRQAGAEGVGVTLDVTDAGSARAMIDAAVQAFERGVKLRRHCEAKLAEVEARVEALVQRSDGSLGTRPLE